MKALLKFTGYCAADIYVRFRKPDAKKDTEAYFGTLRPEVLAQMVKDNDFTLDLQLDVDSLLHINTMVKVGICETVKEKEEIP